MPATGSCRWQYGASVFVYLGSEALPSRVWVVGVSARRLSGSSRRHIGTRSCRFAGQDGTRLVGP